MQGLPNHLNTPYVPGTVFVGGWQNRTGSLAYDPSPDREGGWVFSIAPHPSRPTVTQPGTPRLNYYGGP